MGDDRAVVDLAQLVAEHHQAVYRYAYRLSGAVPDAEDLTQQVFLIAQQKMAQLRNPQAARSWLFTILRNCFIKSCQKKRPIPAGNLRMNIETIPAEVPSAEAIDRDRLQKAIDNLPPAFRMVLGMFYYEGCSYREIAEKLALPLGTVMSRLARAKGHLRSQLFAPDGGLGVRRRRGTVDLRG